MTSVLSWAPVVERSRASRQFEFMVRHAFGERDVGFLSRVIGPPGQLTDELVRELLVEAGALALERPIVLAEIDGWRCWFRGVAGELSEAACLEIDEVMARVGHDVCEDRYWLMLLALASYTALLRDAIREEICRELDEAGD